MHHRSQVAEEVGWSQLSMPRYCDRAEWARQLPLERLEQDGTVITGRNCAGKTTLVRLLRQHGLECYDSETRALNDKVARVLPLAVASMHNDVLNQTAAARHLETIAMLARGADCDVVFDRGLGDIHGMLRMYRWFCNPITGVFGGPLRSFFKDPAIREILGSGLEHSESFEQTTQQLRCIEEWAKIVRYRRVLFLDPLPRYQSDGVRT
ncbi:MAG: hypothetical protein EBZ48_14605, partial [Proteobacteria bacterium]|nr:hypothetical protein [Pseudomonadota bacterium]